MPAKPPVVELEKVQVRFGRVDVLDRVSLAVEAGEILGVCGPNGSGKTTLLRVAAGLVRPNLGKRYGPRHCAYVPATLQPPTVGVHRWPQVVPRRRRRDVGAALDVLDFDGERHKPCRRLSFGNLRKLLLAEALSSGAPLVVIDEATGGLDDRGVDGLAALLAEAAKRGAAVVIADQESQPMAWANRIVRVADGTVTAEDADVDLTRVVLWGPEPGLECLRSEAARLGFFERGNPQR